jgi:hypothetical protein
MPLLFLTQVAFIIAFGVLLDTFVVAPWSCRKPSTCSEIGCGGPAGWPAADPPAPRAARPPPSSHRPDPPNPASGAYPDWSTSVSPAFCCNVSVPSS